MNRFGVSMEQPLVDLLDAFVEREAYPNRSEAIRSLVRDALVRSAEADAQTGSGTDDAHGIAGVVTLIYKYGRSLPRVATDGYPSIHIASNLQLHLSGDVCIKVIVVQGTAGEVRSWAAHLIAAKGVLGHLNLVASDDIYREIGA
jgi:CopG family nickel-responsive transcriptional regulator